MAIQFVFLSIPFCLLSNKINISFCLFSKRRLLLGIVGACSVSPKGNLTLTIYKTGTSCIRATWELARRQMGMPRLLSEQDSTSRNFQVIFFFGKCLIKRAVSKPVPLKWVAPRPKASLYPGSSLKMHKYNARVFSLNPVRSAF